MNIYHMNTYIYVRLIAIKSQSVVYASEVIKKQYQTNENNNKIKVRA